MTKRNIKTYYEEINKLLYFNMIMGLLFFSPHITFLDMDYVIKLGSLFVNSFVPLSLKDALSSKQKEILLSPTHWKHPKPSSRIFTKIKGKNCDDRINVEVLENKYGMFPETPSKQNNLWYKIYLEFQEESQIFYSQKEYLQYRDSMAISLILLLTNLIIYGVLLIFYQIYINYYEFYLVFLLVQFIVFFISARNKSEGFVTTVLAVASVKD